MPAGFWSQLTRFDRSKVQPWIALRNAVGLALPIGAAVAAGQPGYGILVGLGAMNTSFSDGSDPYRLRARRMLAASLLSAVAIVAAALAGWHPAASSVLIGGWALGAGLLVALHATAADIGLLSLVMVLVFTGQQMTPGDALLAGVFASAGGLFQTLLSVALWPVRRYEPERRVIAALYSELSAVAGSKIRASEAPPASARATEAHELIPSLARTHSVQGDRYVSLISQAERIRLNILLLRNAPFLEQVSKITAAIARTLEGEDLEVDPAWLPAVTHEGLAGQLRAAMELATSSTEAGRAAFEQRQLSRPWRLQVENGMATVRANLSLRSSALRHALRLAASVLIGELVAHAAGGSRSYWLPMTVAIVLKPDFTATYTRGVLRIAGTLAGLALATALFHLVTPTPGLEVLLIFAIVFLLRCYGSANYGIFTTLLTAYIVLLFALSGQRPGDIISERGWHTLLGGALALAAYAAWPTWERSQISETLANMLDKYREYFRAVHDRSPELERIRPEGRLARSNMEAAMDRFVAEPGADPDAVTLLSQMMASSHRIIHAMMAIEAGMQSATPEFISFAYQAEITLHSLAQALRGSTIDPEALPDLRRAHSALVRSGDPLVQEADRLTNSVNTLTEQVHRWSMLVLSSTHS
jgi:uncharacterized membrane protein YccC